MDIFDWEAGPGSLESFEDILGSVGPTQREVPFPNCDQKTSFFRDIGVDVDARPDTQPSLNGSRLAQKNSS